MKTLKVINGDFVFDETGNLAMVEGDKEIAQGVMMNLSIRKNEFELDEHIGFDKSFMQLKRVDDEELADNVLEALQVMTDQELIDGADDIEIIRDGRNANVTMNLIKTDGTEIPLEGVDLSGSE
ncbi:DUF2634 domain-containing protein [Viridibacillus sp. NPDC096237]|uniref:DUF2634 domain-containing protein n=1 Tax=Viridibacillus sp. NPDC096237 TaxID=3390721 RepID=UPI003CFDE795